VVKVALPDLGEGTKEATIKEWFVQPGQKVNEFDDLVEVFTDKLVAKIPSTHTGIVKDIKFDIDEVCLVGHALLTIESDEVSTTEEPAAATSHEEPKQPTLQPAKAAPATPAARKAGEKVLSSPSVRVLASKHQIDLDLIVGSGPKGRILKGDVLDFIENGPKTPPPKAAPIDSVVYTTQNLT